MRLEDIPFIFGFFVVLLGLGLIGDAWFGPNIRPLKERRRKRRASISPTGETCIGLAIIFFGIALLGRDTGKFNTIAVMVGTGYIFIGLYLTRRYLWEYLTSRGAERRRPPSERTHVGPTRVKQKFNFKPDPSAPPPSDLPEDLAKKDDSPS